MFLVHLIALKRGGSITLFYDQSKSSLDINTMSSGPAFDALVQKAEAVFRSEERPKFVLSPLMLGKLRDMRFEHGDTLTPQLSSEIDRGAAELFKQVRIERDPERIAPGTTIRLFFNEEKSAFFEDTALSVEGLL